jgi:hypothetical protein
MKPYSLPILVSLGSVLSGCGGSTAELIPLPSHQGTMNELPGKQGYFEIQVQEDAGGERAIPSKQQGPTTIVVYFYGPDGKSEMTPPPSDVKVKLGAGDSSPVVTLSSRSQGGFTSAPGQHPQSFRGQLNAKIGGELVQTNFMIR